jgi:hypothetical protein
VKKNNGLYVFVDSMDRGLSIESKYILLSFKVSVHALSVIFARTFRALSMLCPERTTLGKALWTEPGESIDRSWTELSFTVRGSVHELSRSK